MSKKVYKLSAAWCGPCKQYAPTFEALVTDMESAGWEVFSLDVDDDDGREIATKYGVRGVPTTIIIQDNKDDVVKSGTLSEAQLKEMLGLG